MAGLGLHEVFVVDSAGETTIEETATYSHPVIRLWDRDYNLIAEKPEGQRVKDFVLAHIDPGGYVNLTRDQGGTRWSGRAEVSVKYTQDYEYLKAMLVEPNPWLARSQW